MSFVEVFDELWGEEISFGDPLVVGVWVSFPLYQVLKGTSPAMFSRIEDLIYFVFFLIFD